MNDRIGSNVRNSQQNTKADYRRKAAHAAGHLSADQIQHYADGMLTIVEEERVELHLTACDSCLQLFMAAIETRTVSDACDAESLTASSEQDLETVSKQQQELPDMHQLEERVIAQLISETQHNSPSATVQQIIRRRRTWLQHPVTHYAIAASITIMLLSSGVLASFSEKLQQYDETPYAATPQWDEHAEKSWSEKMINRTSSWLDGLQDARFK